MVADLELRIQMTPYDDHDDVLDALEARRSPQERADAERGWAVIEAAVVPAGSRRGDSGR